MSRVCNREGCGKRILGKDGSPDYRKHFCGSACLRIDKRERLLARRNRLKTGRCPHCGRKPISAALSNGRVKLHNPHVRRVAVPTGVGAETPTFGGSEGRF